MLCANLAPVGLKLIMGAGHMAERRQVVIWFLIWAVFWGTGLFLVGMVWPEFFNLPSLLITLGGSLAVTLLSFSWGQVCDLTRGLWAVLFQERGDPAKRVEELNRWTQLYRLEGPRGLESREHRISDAFLGCGVRMLVDLRREDEIRARLEREMAAVVNQHEVSRQILMNLGRLLPAFGLIGTLIGFVLLLRHIPDQDPRNLTTALSLAVLTTLYGALLANVVVHPLAARLHSIASEKEAMMRLTLEWVLWLARGETPTLIHRRLSALLPAPDADPSREKQWGKIVFSPQR